MIQVLDKFNVQVSSFDIKLDSFVSKTKKKNDPLNNKEDHKVEVRGSLTISFDSFINPKFLSNKSDIDLEDEDLDDEPLEENFDLDDEE